jgi:hypothetical protein
MFILISLGVLLVAGAANTAAQRLTVHSGVETWPSSESGRRTS